MVEPTGETYTFHYNGIGSTIAITDQDKNMVNKYFYTAFGLLTNEEETIPQPFKYVAQYGIMYEPNGFYYMRARYYDPEVGRFVSEDPSGLAGGINLYAYVNNNPINFVDPSGLCGEKGFLEEFFPELLTASGLIISGISVFVESPTLFALGVSLSTHSLLLDEVSPLGGGLSGAGLVVGTVGTFTANPFLISLGFSMSLHGAIVDFPVPPPPRLEPIEIKTYPEVTYIGEISE